MAVLITSEDEADIAGQAKVIIEARRSDDSNRVTGIDRSRMLHVVDEEHGLAVTAPCRALPFQLLLEPVPSPRPNPVTCDLPHRQGWFDHVQISSGVPMPSLSGLGRLSVVGPVRVHSGQRLLVERAARS
jgi:hypothetical protein